MNCPHCQASIPDESNFCQLCGKRLRAAPPGDATLQLSLTQVRAPAARQRSFDVPALLGDRPRLVVGRAADCDVSLRHPCVSRYHALVEQRPDGLYVRDLSSVNGVWVAGRRITEPARLREGDRVGVGPFLLTLTRNVLHSLDNSKSLRLEASRLEKVVPLPGGGRRKLLDDINLVVHPGEFVTLLGPSGSGKSTLMDCLNGRRRATGGTVLANGEDFYHHFDSFRQSLGYVPQKDIVHAGLSVCRALLYTARLRLPLDTDRHELHARVESVLEEMELLPHRDTLIGELSGGQIKRVSLGAELIGQPAMLYIDEATSGLDAGTEARMMRLFRGLADQGRSLLCITHNVENVDQCHLVLVLARGKLVYYGPPAEAPRYFRVARVCDIYDRLAQRDLAGWEKDFRASSLYREFILDRMAGPSRSAEPPPPPPAPTPPTAPAPPAEGGGGGSWPLSGMLAEQFRQLEAGYLRWRDYVSPLAEAWNQFCVLTARYVELMKSDRRSLRLLALQAPIVALFLLAGFAAKDYTQPMPLLRPLTDGERRTLTVLRGMSGLVDGDRPLTAAQRQTLAQIRVEAAGVPFPVDGNALLGILRRLQRQPLTPEQQEALRQTQLTLQVDGDPVQVTGAEAVEAWRLFNASRIPEDLLQVSGPVVPDGVGVNPGYTYIVLFILVMIVLWFGCNNAAKEIVKEEAVYARERAVNLRIAPYLASKFVVLGAVTALHVLVLMLVLFGALELLARWFPGNSVPPPVYMLAYPQQFGVLLLLGLTGVALGLLLSACVSSPDRANTLLPYVLIPQLILGGGMMPLGSGVLYYLAAALSPVYWAYRAVHLGGSTLPRGYPGHVDYPDGLTLPCLALAGQAVVLLALTAWALRRKEA
jgi:ABC-type multidrug transport system ATPase subunit